MSRAPIVDNDACIGDQECLNVCQKNVFDWDEENAKPIVARPDNCEDCDDCIKICPTEALSKPS
jgi:NAD-dependent dihydropyrimidine dehydrogenase PreA subunit